MRTWSALCDRVSSIELNILLWKYNIYILKTNGYWTLQVVFNLSDWFCHKNEIEFIQIEVWMLVEYLVKLAPEALAD